MSSVSTPPPPPPVAFHIIGDAFVDLFSFLDGNWPEIGGDACLREAVTTYAGGSAVNTSTHLKSLIRSDCQLQQQQQQQPSTNDDVVLHTTLNQNDNFGEILTNHVNNHGFQLVNCKSESDETSTGHCIVIVSNNERTFMTYRGCNANFSANRLKMTNFEIPSNLHVQIAGYFNLTGLWNGNLKEFILQLREQRKKEGKSTTVSLVPQHDATKEWDGGIDDVICCLDFLIMNELEANSIANRRAKANEESPAVDSISVDYWISSFCSISDKTCFVITLGDKGAVAIRDGKLIAEQRTLAVQPIDPTGAGDAFCAGFMHGLWARQQQKGEYGITKNDDDPIPVEAIENGLRWGCAVGTSAVLTVGASAPSPAEEIKQRYNQLCALEKR